jgi:hypothetical protein
MEGRGQPTKWNAWYSSARWARIRKQQLLAHPLCQFRLERGIVTPAARLGPFQSLCKRCHDSAKIRRVAWLSPRYWIGRLAVGPPSSGLSDALIRSPLKPRAVKSC